LQKFENFYQVVGFRCSVVFDILEYGAAPDKFCYLKRTYYCN